MTPEDYLQLLLVGDDDACLAEGRSRATDLDGLRNLYTDLIGPSQVRVGDMWEAGDISVDTEHLVTAINRYVASACYAPLAHATHGGPRAVVACTLDEMHDLGARMLADLLECDGWDVDFYGPSITAAGLIEQIRQRRPRFVGLSTALVIHLGSVKKTIDMIRATLGAEAPPIVVGGNAYRTDEGLWRLVGADLYADDATDAVTLLRSLKC